MISLFHSNIMISSKYTMILVSAPIIFFLFGVVLVLYMNRNNKYWKERGVPFVKPIPIFGNALMFFMCKEFSGAFFRRMYENCRGPLVGIFLLDKPCLLIKDINLVKKIIIEDFEYFPNRTSAVTQDTDPFGKLSLFASEVPQWSKDRKSLSSVFTAGKLKSKTDQISGHGDEMTYNIRKKIFEEGNKLNIKQFTNRFAVNSILSAFYGVNDVRSPNSPFLAITKTIFESGSRWTSLQVAYRYMAPKLFGFFRMSFVDSKVTNFFRDFTWELVSERERLGRKNNDLIDVLIDVKQRENIQDKLQCDLIASHCYAIFAAGYKATSTTLALTLFHLAKNPNCQNLARDEAKTVFQRHGDFTYESIKDFKYLKYCILETLRMYPIGPMLDRRCEKDYKVPGMDLIIEKGTRIFISVWGIQNDPDYYSDPSQYDPDRFNEENGGKSLDFSFLAFSAGPHHCPGQRFALLSSTLCLAKILLNFEVKLPEGSPNEIKPNPFGRLFQPKDDIYLDFTSI